MRRSPERLRGLTAALLQDRLALCRSLSSRFEFRRRSYQSANLVSEPGKITLVPGEENICPRLHSAMGNQGVINSAAHDGRRHRFNGRDVLIFCERHQGQPIADLPKDINRISSSNAWSHW